MTRHYPDLGDPLDCSLYLKTRKFNFSSSQYRFNALGDEVLFLTFNARLFWLFWEKTGGPLPITATVLNVPEWKVFVKVVQFVMIV